MLIVNNENYRMARNEKHPEIINYHNKKTGNFGIIKEPLKYAMATTIEELVQALKTIKNDCSPPCRVDCENLKDDCELFDAGNCPYVIAKEALGEVNND